MPSSRGGFRRRWSSSTRSSSRHSPEGKANRASSHHRASALLSSRSLTLTACNAATVSPSPQRDTPSPDATTTPSPSPATATASPRPQPQPPPAHCRPKRPGGSSSSADELVDAGWPADVTAPGTYTWTFADGRARLDLEEEDGDTFFCEAVSWRRWTMDFVSVTTWVSAADEVDDIDWTLEEDGLHLTLITYQRSAGPAESVPRDEARQPVEDGSVEGPSAIEPGLVDIGDRSLLLDCRGSGSPDSHLPAR